MCIKFQSIKQFENNCMRLHFYFHLYIHDLKTHHTHKLYTAGKKIYENFIQHFSLILFSLFLSVFFEIYSTYAYIEAINVPFMWRWNILFFNQRKLFIYLFGIILLSFFGCAPSHWSFFLTSADFLRL